MVIFATREQIEFFFPLSQIVVTRLKNFFLEGFARGNIIFSRESYVCEKGKQIYSVLCCKQCFLPFFFFGKRFFFFLSVSHLIFLILFRAPISLPIISSWKTDQKGDSFYFIVPKNPSQPYRCPFILYNTYISSVKNKTGRFFRNKPSYSQNMGKNSIGSLPSKIASILQLPNPSSFTGHCFRRSAATFLADNGSSLLDLKRFGHWKSDKVAQSYVDNSLTTKKKSRSSSYLHQ
jgi:hypothetical protein